MTRLLVLILPLLLLSGCSLLQKSIQEPTVHMEKVRLISLGFDHAELEFELRIDNPNRIGITLTELDYVLFLSDQRFLSGSSAVRTTLTAHESTRLKLPVRVVFKEASAAIGSWAKAAEAPYRLEARVQVDLPILGIRTLEASHSDTLPIPRLPSIKLDRITLSDLSFSGARLDLELIVDNPGGISLMLENLDYGLTLGQQRVASLSTPPQSRIEPGGQNRLHLSVDLDLRRLGLGFYRQLTSGGVDYQVLGESLIRPLHPLMERATLPFSSDGKLPRP